MGIGGGKVKTSTPFACLLTVGIRVSKMAFLRPPYRGDSGWKYNLGGSTSFLLSLLIADMEVKPDDTLAKTIIRWCLGVEKCTFWVAHYMGIRSRKYLFWEGPPHVGIREGTERPGSREKEIEFEIPDFPKTRRASAAFW